MSRFTTREHGRATGRVLAAQARGADRASTKHPCKGGKGEEKDAATKAIDDQRKKQRKER